MKMIDRDETAVFRGFLKRIENEVFSDTPRRLEFWPNHYSLFNEKMWVSLFGRSGFKALVSTRLEFSLQMTSINEGQPFLQSNLVFVLQKEREEIILLEKF